MEMLLYLQACSKNRAVTLLYCGMWMWFGLAPKYNISCHSSEQLQKLWRIFHDKKSEIGIVVLCWRIFENQNEQNKDSLVIGAVFLKNLKNC